MSPAHDRESAESQAASERLEAEDLQVNSNRDEKIRRRAYQIYVERGENPGRELDDWLQAEREVDGIL
jgi:hypothetical protein